MATLRLKCRNCGNIYSYTTPYPTYVGKPGEVEVTGPDLSSRNLYPSCPSCTSHACHIMNQSA